MKTLKEFKVKGKRVLARVDFNVPLSEKGDILDDFRIRMALPTIEYLLERGAKVVLMSHLGRPEGKIVESLKMDKVQEKLTELLEASVTKAQDCIGPEIEGFTREMQDGEILLLENLRFHKEEEQNDKDFAKSLSRLGDIYINDAFSVSHRAHASVALVPKLLPSGAGLMLVKEIENLKKIKENPARPLVAVLGGKKVETKSKLIDKISETGDWILISGLLEKEIKEKKINLKNLDKIICPVDEVAGGLDVGPGTVKKFKEKILSAKTIFWNGPLGKVEDEEYSSGTKEVSRAIIESQAFSVAGGGETVEFINKLGLFDNFSHVSTGGEAMVAFLSGEILPGIEALEP